VPVEFSRPTVRAILRGGCIRSTTPALKISSRLS
jgi:hypothetical protein